MSNDLNIPREHWLRRIPSIINNTSGLQGNNQSPVNLLHNVTPRLFSLKSRKVHQPHLLTFVGRFKSGLPHILIQSLAISTSPMHLSISGGLNYPITAQILDPHQWDLELQDYTSRWAVGFWIFGAMPPQSLVLYQNRPIAGLLYRHPGNSRCLRRANVACSLPKPFPTITQLISPDPSSSRHVYFISSLLSYSHLCLFTCSPFLLFHCRQPLTYLDFFALD